MNNKTKKVISLTLLILLLFSSLPMNLISYGIQDHEMYKNIEKVFLLTAEAFVTTPAAIGENVEYTFNDSTGELNISGNGEMYEIDEDAFSPFFEFANDIITVTIDDGITNIPNHLFESCTSLTEVKIPDSVKSIGIGAFAFCNSLVEINLPDGLLNIGQSAFHMCEKIEKITIPEGVTTIKEGAFWGCLKLSNVILSKYTTKLERDAFTNCKSLNSITIPALVSEIDDFVFNGCPLEKIINQYQGNQTIGQSAFKIIEPQKPIRIETYIENINFIESIGIHIDESLYDLYILNKYTVNFETNGGSLIGDESVSHGDMLIMPNNPVKEGCIFGGWYSDSTLNVPWDSSTKIHDNITLYAKWDMKKVTDIEVFSLPTKISYYEDEDLNVSGGKVKVNYNDDSSEIVDMSLDMVTGYDNMKVGKQTLTITYEGNTTSFEVTVIKHEVIEREVTDIEISSIPTKISYYEDEDLNVSGGKVKVNYNDDSSEIVDMSLDMVTGYDNTKVGKQTLTVTYEDKATSFEVTVIKHEVIEKEVTSLEIFVLPAKLLYYEDEDLNVSGGEINVIYDDGSSEIINISPDMVIGYDNETIGNQTLTVSYRGQTTSFEVTVRRYPGDSNHDKDDKDKDDKKNNDLGNKPKKTRDKSGDSNNPELNNKAVEPITNNKLSIVFRWDLKINNIDGYIKGYEDNTFRPNRYITRAEIAQILSNIILNSGDYKNNFRDIGNSWYTPAVNKVIGLQIMRGFDDNTFKPDNYITRQDMAVTLANLLDVNKSVGSKNIMFSDIGGKYGEESIKKLASLEIISGYRDGTFRPDNCITRTEVVVLINGILQDYMTSSDKKHVTIDDIERSWAPKEIIKAYKK